MVKTYYLKNKQYEILTKGPCDIYVFCLKNKGNILYNSNYWEKNDFFPKYDKNIVTSPELIENYKNEINDFGEIFITYNNFKLSFANILDGGTNVESLSQYDLTNKVWLEFNDWDNRDDFNNKYYFYHKVVNESKIVRFDAFEINNTKNNSLLFILINPKNI